MKEDFEGFSGDELLTVDSEGRFMIIDLEHLEHVYELERRGILRRAVNFVQIYCTRGD